MIADPAGAMLGLFWSPEAPDGTETPDGTEAPSAAESASEA